MRWGAPEVLPWLILLIPLGLLLIAVLRYRLRRLAAIADAATWGDMLSAWNESFPRRRTLLWFLAVSLLATALARPQWGFTWREVKKRGLDLVVCLDTSKSMLAQDIAPNRLEQAKWGIQDLIRQLRGDRVGLVPFAGSAFLQCPLTSDYAAFMLTLNDIYAGIIPRGGTDIAAALRTALESFGEGGEADRVILLVTDGEAHTGSLNDALDECLDRGIRVYAIGVGTVEGELIPESDAATPSAFLKDREGHVVKTALNEKPLQRLALATGGAYIRSAPGDFGVERLYREHLAALRRDEKESRMAKDYEDRFMWLLGAALVLLAAEALLAGAPYRRRIALLPLLLPACLFLSTAARAESDPRALMKEGLHAYEDGQYEEAAEAFSEAARAADPEELDPAAAHLNTGNAAYRMGDPQTAAAAYSEAQRTDDTELLGRAAFNRGNAMNRLAIAADEGQKTDEALSFARQAERAYEQSILLNPNDLDAKVNFELNRRLMEELRKKQQQEQQQKQQEQKQDNQEEQQQQEQEQEQKQEQQQNGDDQQQQEQQEKQESPPQDQNEDREPTDESSAQEQQQAEPKSEEMTEEEARMLLDAMRQEEMSERSRIKLQLGQPGAVEKDW